MMDRNYPTSSFTDPLASPAQTAAWAYERSTASIKPSLSYGATHPETELLHRQTYAASHQLPSYAAAHHATGLSGIFDTGLHTAGSNTTETSVMNFLSAIESRNQQAGPAAAALLPQFRTPSWQTGMHSSAATELFVTGAIPASGTFPPTSALSAYQHPNTFTTRNFATTPSLTLQDAAFSPSSNGLLSPHDPLLQIKSTQGTVPTALAFDRIGSTVLSTSLPPQSSTYRSAQESAPHLLQPQFSLLPSSLGGAQQATQPYSTSVFTGSATSIERALQRECSVIKHHQRPSSTQSVQAQLSSTQHSLQGYLTSGSEVAFQDPSRQSAMPCSPIGDTTQVSNGGPQQKTSQATLEQTQAYPSSIPSPGFSSASNTKAKDCSTKHTQPSSKTSKSQSVSPDVQPQSYPSPVQKQSTVIASQPQVYTSAQLPSLMSVSQSQNYVTSQAMSSSVSHSQVYSSSQSEKLPSLYKTLTSFSGQSENLTSASQTLSYSSSQQQVLSTVGHNEEYVVQAQDLCSVNPSQSYSSSHSQGMPTVSYSAQSQGLSSVSPSQSYASGQSLTLTSQSLSFSSTRAQNLPASSPTQNYMLMHSSPSSQTKNGSPPQSQKYLPPVQSPSFTSSSHSQALPNNRPSADLKPSYGKRKSDSNLFVPSKQEEDEFPIQDLQALQQASLEASAQTLAESAIGDQTTPYIVSKTDDRYNSQSVIRSNSRPEDQMVGLTLQESKKGDRMTSMSHHGQHIVGANNRVSQDIKKNSNLTQPAHITISAEDLKQHSLLHKVPDSRSQNHQAQVISAQQQQQGQNHATRQAQHIRLPSAQVLLEPSRDLQMIFLQQSLLHSGIDPSKISSQMQQIPAQYLQMDDQIINSNGGPNQSHQILSPSSEVLKMDVTESSKSLQQHLSPKDNYSQPSQHESKHHFALSSICFPDSMLLADERNILSNVDDILAATAAACGVTPQDFVKPNSSEGEIPSLASPADSKTPFQVVEARHVSPSFTSQHSGVANPQNMSMALNGGQLNMGMHSVSAVQPKASGLEHQGLQDSNIQPGLTAPSANSRHEVGDRNVSSVQKSRGTNHESEEENEDVPDDEALNHNDPDFIPSGRSISDESAASENEFNLANEEYDPTGLLNKAKSQMEQRGKAQVQPRGRMNSKNDETILEFSPDGLPKKKNKTKGSGKPTAEDENGNAKPMKRSGQGKRQNSRGSDTNSPSTSDSCYDSYQHQERIRQKIREVEEKQPEVKTGFIGSFLDFLKSGPKQQFSSPPIRMPNRTRKPPVASIRPPYPLPLPVKPQPLATPLISPEPDSISPSKRLDDELKKNLETLPSFSSDEDDSVGKNQDLQKSISSALSALDEPSEKKIKSEAAETNLLGAVIKQEQSPSMPSSVFKSQEPPAAATESPTQDELQDVPSDQLAVKLTSVAIEGLTDEDQSDSGGEGMYRERDEFVVKIEDIECLKITLRAGREPPAIWKVQKALLQKFVPELRDGNRVFSATNSYLGYFGDAKTKYRRVYVKFIDTVNKREYVRVCNRKPRCKPMHSVRGGQSKSVLSSRSVSAPASDQAAPKPTSSKGSAAKPKAKQPKVKAEPPPKKRKKWKEEFSSSPSESSPEAVSEDDEFTPPVPFATRFLNTRTMKETFKSYVELLISVALDADMMEALEKESDELLLPHMKRVDGMITDNRRRLLPKLRVGQLFKNALDSFPELSVVTDMKKDGETSSFKVRLSGKAYNKKTLRPTKTSSKLPLVSHVQFTKEYTVDKEKTHWFSLYHSLQHYKYHTYLMCKDEIAALQKQSEEDLGQEETVQLCMKNARWVESLFEKFGELLTQVQQTCL
ncbi:glutamine and serine-rich protein 1 isoform X1 [Lepisosteus oculatus]|uniref:glutamine and serine-rich protein 1 isoform X1 n=1 Tax=Lepisosteus oculatus TaxID=7918 RepID=UPI00074009A8|nr:PREDICTED: glutamine and serine-rich protein 1 isoform X1 [Lepisosteus oculatus]